MNWTGNRFGYGRTGVGNERHGAFEGQEDWIVILRPFGGG